MESQLLAVLTATLDDNTATVKSATAQLKAAGRAPGFASCLVKIMGEQGSAAQAHVKQAAAVAFKNFVKNGWDPESKENGDADHAPVGDADKQLIRQHLVQLMCSARPSVMAQLAEALRIISVYDFPDNWRELLPDLVRRLAQAMQSNNWSVYNGVLETANSIFKRFRYVGKSDALFTQLLYIFGIFCGPMLQHFSHLVAQLPNLQSQPANAAAGQRKPPYASCLEALRTLSRIFFSLNWQDLPEAFEDNIDAWMGHFRTLMSAAVSVESCPALAQITADDEPSPVENLQAAIIENLVLYSEKYEEEFQKFMGSFTQQIWMLLKEKVRPVPRFDPVVTTALRFLTSAVKKPWNKELFAQPGFLKAICEGVVLPGLRLRDEDEEDFEDNPVEYIRRDMEGADGESRRRAACELVQGLCVLFKQEVTQLCGGYINQLLVSYKNNPSQNWKDKDAALTLFLALGAKGQTRAHGATSVNELVPIGNFFQTEIGPELDCSGGADINGVSPVLKADAIKFASVFRSVLPANLVMQCMGPFIRLLAAKPRVVHTYAAHGIERLLALRRPKDNAVTGGSLSPESLRNAPALFNKTNLAQYLQPLLQALLALMAPVDYAENEYLMRCMVRTITCAEETIAPHAPTLINALGILLARVCGNPSNPTFNHCLFESLSALVRYVGGGSGGSSVQIGIVDKFEGALFGPFTSVLTRDVTEFKPYVFQIFAQLLEMRKGHGISPGYWNLFQPCLTASLWTRANTPALSRLLTAYLNVDAPALAQRNQLQPLLGCWLKAQSSVSTQAAAFELITAFVTNLPMTAFEQFLPNIVQTLITRMQKHLNLRFVSGFLGNFWGVLVAKHGCACLEQNIERLQVKSVTKQFLRKGLCIAGSRMLAESSNLRGNGPLWAKVASATIELAQLLATNKIDEASADAIGAEKMKETMLKTASGAVGAAGGGDGAGEGYAAKYAQLKHAAVRPADYFPDVGDPRQHLAKQMAALVQQAGGAAYQRRREGRLLLALRGLDAGAEDLNLLAEASSSMFSPSSEEKRNADSDNEPSGDDSDGDGDTVASMRPVKLIDSKDKEFEEKEELQQSDHVEAAKENESAYSEQQEELSRRRRREKLRSLCFDSHFESGNLLRAVKVGPYEYDLYIRPDINTTGFQQWWYFSLCNTHPPGWERQLENVRLARKNVLQMPAKHDASLDAAAELGMPASALDINHPPEDEAERDLRVLGKGPNGTGLDWTGAMTYRFNIVNLCKPDSMYNRGMQPVMYSCRDAEGRGIGWRRTGRDICYFANDLLRGGDNANGQHHYTLTFKVSFGLPENVYLLAHSIPYTWTDNLRHIDALLTLRPHCVRRSILCHTLAGRQCDVLTITDFDTGELINGTKEATKDHFLECGLASDPVNSTSSASRGGSRSSEDFSSSSTGRGGWLNNNGRSGSGIYSGSSSAANKGSSGTSHGSSSVGDVEDADGLGNTHTRRVIVMTARVHPGESPASWITKGFIDFITSKAPAAQLLRRMFVFKIVPMINPDGVFYGNNRCSLAGVDLNRQWQKPTPHMHPTIHNSKAMIRHLHGTRECALYVDMHAHSRKGNVFMYGVEEKNRMKPTVRLFPALLDKSPFADTLFSFKDCTFNVGRGRESTARVVVARELMAVEVIMDMHKMGAED
eukprot:g3469.t1